MSEVQIRPAQPTDLPQVIALLRVALGKGDDPDYEAFFRWKHEQSPFGPSPSWVATTDGRVVGFRTFMRWEFERGGQVLRAVRAVDTATAPDFRGQGVFSRLTRTALEELRADGVDLVFNTPNDQSRPGYLKMGWRLVGRLPVLVCPRSVVSAARLFRARVPARLWSEPLTVGAPVSTQQTWGPSGPGTDPTILRTRRTPEFMAWRYGFAPLHYRLVSSDHGCAVVRVRRRGAARELVFADDTATGAAARRRIVGDALARTRADYALLLGGRSEARRGVPVTSMGPTLTCLPLSAQDSPPLASWGLTLGDVELF